MWRDGRWLRLLAGLLVLAVLSACGAGDEGDETQGDDNPLEATSPENLLKLVFEEVKTGEFSCASPYYFGEYRINAYYDASVLGTEGTVGVCRKLREDAQQDMYRQLWGSEATPTQARVEGSGRMPRTLNDRNLPYAEGTLTLSDGKQMHINRMVQHEGLWYVLVLRGYPRLYE